MKSRAAFLAFLTCVALPSRAVSSNRVSPFENCSIDSMAAAAKVVKSLIGCQGDAAKSGLPPDAACFAGSPLEPCYGTDSVSMDRGVEDFLRDLVLALRPSNLESKCAAGKLKAVKNYAASLLTFRAKLELLVFSKLLTRLARAQDKLHKAFVRAERFDDCLTVDDEQAIGDRVDRFVNELHSLTNSGFADQIFVNQVVSGSTVPTPVTLIGALRFARQGQFMGAVGMKYGNGGLAILDARNGDPPQITVGNDVVRLSGANPGDLVVNGVVIDVSTAFTSYFNEVTGIADPSTWSSSSQAILALSALTSTNVWNLDFAKMLARYGTGVAGQSTTAQVAKGILPTLTPTQLLISPRGALDIIQDACELGVGPPPFCNPVPILPHNPCNPLPGPLDPIDCPGIADDAADLDPIDICAMSSSCVDTFCDVSAGGFVHSLSLAAGPQGGQMTCQAVCVALVASPLPGVDEAACMTTCLSVGAAATAAYYVGQGCSDPPPSPNPTPPMYCPTGECGCFALDQPHLCHLGANECCTFWSFDNPPAESPLCHYAPIVYSGAFCHTPADCREGFGEVCGWGSAGGRCGFDAPAGCETILDSFGNYCCCPAPTPQICAPYFLLTVE